MKTEYASEAVKSRIMSFMGLLNYGKAGIIFLNSKSEDSGIIKVNSNYLDQLRTSLSLIKTINDNNAVIKTVRVSGMLNKVNNA